MQQLGKKNQENLENEEKMRDPPPPWKFCGGKDSKNNGPFTLLEHLMRYQ